jgi:hypothetical protein
MRVLILLVLLTVASTALVQAQITETSISTTNRVVSDSSSSGTRDVRSVSPAARKLFTCATTINNTNP